jgi:hypothetical protein
MKSEDFDISLDLIRLMDAQHAKEFEILLSRFSSDAQIKHYRFLDIFSGISSMGFGVCRPRSRAWSVGS